MALTLIPFNTMMKKVKEGTAERERRKTECLSKYTEKKTKFVH